MVGLRIVLHCVLITIQDSQSPGMWKATYFGWQSWPWRLRRFVERRSNHQRVRQRRYFCSGQCRCFRWKLDLNQHADQLNSDPW